MVNLKIKRFLKIKTTKYLPKQKIPQHKNNKTPF